MIRPPGRRGPSAFLVTIPTRSAATYTSDENGTNATITTTPAMIPGTRNAGGARNDAMISVRPRKIPSRSTAMVMVIPPYRSCGQFPHEV